MGCGYADIVHGVTATIETSEAFGKIVPLGETLLEVVAHLESVDPVGDKEQGQRSDYSVYAEQNARKADVAWVADEVSVWKHDVLESSSARQGSARLVVSTPHLIPEEDLRSQKAVTAIEYSHSVREGRFVLVQIRRVGYW